MPTASKLDLSALISLVSFSRVSPHSALVCSNLLKASRKAHIGSSPVVRQTLLSFQMAPQQFKVL